MKKVDDLTEQEKRKERKCWQKAKQKSWKQEKEILEQINLLNTNTPPGSASDKEVQHTDGRAQSNKLKGRRKTRWDRAKRYTTISKLENEIQELKKTSTRNVNHENI